MLPVGNPCHAEKRAAAIKTAAWLLVAAQAEVLSNVATVLSLKSGFTRRSLRKLTVEDSILFGDFRCRIANSPSPYRQFKLEKHLQAHVIRHLHTQGNEIHSDNIPLNLMLINIH